MRVYSHRVCLPKHPLLHDVNTRFDAPHSRFNDISRGMLARAGLTVLAESADAGVHMAVSPDQFRVVYFQGHPEYDFNSLFKEYKREVSRFLARRRDDLPPYPDNYFSHRAAELVDAYVAEMTACDRRSVPVPVELEHRIEAELDNTWGDTAKAIFNNWLGLVYQLTNLDRRKLFMPGIDPDDPLGMR